MEADAAVRSGDLVKLASSEEALAVIDVDDELKKALPAHPENKLWANVMVEQICNALESMLRTGQSSKGEWSAEDLTALLATVHNDKLSTVASTSTNSSGELKWPASIGI